MQQTYSMLPARHLESQGQQRRAQWKQTDCATRLAADFVLARIVKPTSWSAMLYSATAVAPCAHHMQDAMEADRKLREQQYAARRDKDWEETLRREAELHR
jgi:hypothetical protein